MWAIIRVIVAKISGEALPQQQPPGPTSTSSTPTFSTTNTSSSNSLFEQKVLSSFERLEKGARTNGHFLGLCGEERCYLEEVFVKEGMADAKPAEVEPSTTNPAAEEKQTKSFDEDAEMTKSFYIEIDDKGTKEATSTPAPPKDSTATVPPTSTEAMTKQDRKIDRIIDEITKSDNEEEDMPLQSLK
ncbi:hypothetical protein GOBAR_DD01667 [Gossypium barbadense]|nr:hypothetical protein GOBAR_DD01667 [Gossypium barbadense]